MITELPELDQEEINRAIENIEAFKGYLDDKINDLKEGTLQEKIFAWNKITFLINSHHDFCRYLPVLYNTGYALHIYGDDDLSDIAKLERHPIFKQEKYQHHEDIIKQIFGELFVKEPPKPSEHNKELAKKLAAEIGIDLDD